MTIEEKAKAYDNAVINGSRLWECGAITRENYEYIFPKLKESEDEKIRKTLIEYIKGHLNETENISRAEAIAWLEKQGESYTKRDVDDAFVEGMVYAKSELEKQGEKDRFIKEEIKCIEGYRENAIKKLEELEKQCEQKPTDEVKPKFKVGDIIEYVGERKELIDGKYEIKEIGNDFYVATSGTIIPFKFEKYYINKTEPKFHEGDWIVQENIGVYKVIEVCEFWYEVVDNKDKHYSIGFDKEYMCHLFTVADAKDGDVLASKDGQSILIFRNLDTSTSFSSYYNIQEKGELGWSNECFIPATKEQRDQLEKAMADAGYEWDSEKKEPKKINKNTDVVHEYFSELLENDNSDNIDDYASQCAYCMSHDWLKDTATWDDVERACKLGAEWNEKHHKSSWSEEDERICRNIVNDIANDKSMCKYEISKGICDEQINWLKSLKDRVQPKQEWNEQEQVRINRIVSCLENLNVADNDILLKDVEWLKSLKERVQPIHEYSDTEKQEIFLRSQRPHFWRPSEEQVKALKYVAYHLMPDSNYRQEMFSLYEDLKKLTE